MIRDRSENDARPSRNRPQSLIVEVRRHTLYGKNIYFVHPLSLTNAFRARLPPKMELEDVKNEAILRDFLQKCNLNIWSISDLLHLLSIAHLTYCTSYLMHIWPIAPLIYCASDPFRLLFIIAPRISSGFPQLRSVRTLVRDRAAHAYVSTAVLRTHTRADSCSTPIFMQIRNSSLYTSAAPCSERISTCADSCSTRILELGKPMINHPLTCNKCIQMPHWGNTAEKSPNMDELPIDLHSH